MIGSFYELMVQCHRKYNLQYGHKCAQCYLKPIFGKWDVDSNEFLSMLNDGMASSVLCFLHFEQI